MMASKNKKVISKDDLRRLMKQQQKTEKKIDSPLAKYDSLGQLHCSLCGCKVKNELLWTAHVNGRTHKQNVVILKEKEKRRHEATVRPPEPSHSSKRKSQDDEEGSLNKIRKGHNSSNKSATGVPTDFFDSGSSSSTVSKKKLQCIGDYESDDENDSDEIESPGDAVATTDTGLPTDFFDSGVVPSSSKQSSEDTEVKNVKTMAEQLPEGFFDDAKQDAKARKIEYKDKREEEWELFQKAMKEENQVSEAIQEEDDEALQVERNIDQIDEQIYHWSKVEELHQRKEEVMSHGDKMEQDVDSSNSDLDEQDYEEFLDWRSKKAL